MPIARARRMQAVIADLARLGRPLLLTEWMARPLGSRIADILPLLAMSAWAPGSGAS